GDKIWCVAKIDATTQQLLDALNYACGGGADCDPIQLNGSCYNQKTIESHTSYDFNSFYKKNKQPNGTYDFAGSAHVVSIDPSMNITFIWTRFLF
ncbi:hypothetical protein RYX36_011511, partial [Vicia faba]